MGRPSPEFHRMCLNSMFGVGRLLANTFGVERVKRRGRHAPLRRWAFSASASSFLIFLSYFRVAVSNSVDSLARNWQYIPPARLTHAPLAASAASTSGKIRNTRSSREVSKIERKVSCRPLRKNFPPYAPPVPVPFADPKVGDFARRV